MSTIQITDEEFDAYEPIDNPFQEESQLFETFGKELSYVLDQEEQYIWTQIDGDDGIYIVNGYQLVNRIGYYITKKPHDIDSYLEVCVIKNKELND